MKRLLLLTAIAILLLSSCAPVYYSIGMDEREFYLKNKGKGVYTVEASVDRTVYKYCNQSCYFYYFRDNRLYQVDQGDYNPNLILFY